MAGPIVTFERLRELLDYDPATGVFRWKTSRSQRAKVGSVAGRLERHGYLRIRIDGQRYSAHRLAWLYVHGEWPSEDLDHINRRRDDNRLSNLRLATRPQNLGNTGVFRHNTSGRKGVSFHKASGKWQAVIHVAGKQVYLGLHDTAESAHAAYSAKAREVFGEFADD